MIMIIFDASQSRNIFVFYYGGYRCFNFAVHLLICMSVPQPQVLIYSETICAVLLCINVNILWFGKRVVIQITLRRTHITLWEQKVTWLMIILFFKCIFQSDIKWHYKRTQKMLWNKLDNIQTVILHSISSRHSLRNCLLPKE